MINDMIKSLFLASLVVLVGAISAPGAHAYSGEGSQKAAEADVSYAQGFASYAAYSSAIQTTSNVLLSQSNFLAVVPGSSAYLDIGRSGSAGAAKRTGIRVWVNGAYNHIDNDFLASRFEGSASSIAAGIDNRFKDWLVAGVAVGYEFSDIDTQFNFGTVEGTGVSVTPYVAVRVAKSTVLDFSGSYAWLQTDITRAKGAVTGAHDSTRYTLAANITQDFSTNKLLLQATAGFVYMEQKNDAYRESAGTLISNTVTTIGQVRVGGKVGYKFKNFIPYFQVRYENDVDDVGSSVSTTALVSQPIDDDGFFLAVGTEMRLSNFITGKIEFSSVEAREELHNYGVSGTVRIRF